MRDKRSLPWRFADGLTTIGSILGGAALVLMALLITVEILLRALLRRSTLISDELSAYLLVLIIFLSLPYCLRTGGMIRVEIIFRRLSGTVRSWAELFCLLVAISFMVILAYQCWLFAWESFDFGYRSIMPSGLPLWIPQLAIPVGCSLMIIELLVQLIHLIHKLKAQR